LSHRSRNWFILLMVTTLTLVVDRVSKTIIANNLTLNTSWHLPTPFLRRLFSLTYTTNTGAAFGLFPNQGVLFIIIAFVVVMAIIFYYAGLPRHLPAGYGLVRLALGLQLGGALGNLIDRLRQGYVIDFIDLNFWPLQNWPVFNLADSTIVVGVGLLAITMLREDISDQDEEIASPESNADQVSASEPGTSS
jgi:signal peptidase II